MRRPYTDRTPQYDAALYKALVSAISANLTTLRGARGWSQVDAAARCRMSLWQYQRLEGALTNPTLTSLVRLVDGFGITLGELLGSAMNDASRPSSLSRDTDDHVADTPDAPRRRRRSTR